MPRQTLTEPAMLLDLSLIALDSSPPGQTARVELAWDHTEKSLVLLHDEQEVGTFARVYRGRVGQGDLLTEVAIKIQRDQALTQEERDRVAGKFDRERQIHRRLQKGATPEELQSRGIIRQFDVWPLPEEETYEIPPCIVCPNARHGLRPRCPYDGTVLEPSDFLRAGDDRCLVCPTCQEHHRQAEYREAYKDAILRATVQKDEACAGCPHREVEGAAACLEGARVLNFFPARMLLLELLDLDLEDYLRWSKLHQPPRQRGQAWRRFQEHTKALKERGGLDGDLGQGLHRLGQITDLFSRILNGVDHLHRQDIAHLDLKPANICVRFQGGYLDPKVIDLGLSDDPQTLGYLRQLGSGAGSSEYAAPEFHKPPYPKLYNNVQAWIEGDGCTFLMSPEKTSWWDPVICPGDQLLIQEGFLAGQAYRVRQVATRNGGWQVWASLPDPKAWDGSQTAVPSFSARRDEIPLSFIIEKHRGLSSDIFSLGLILLALLSNEPDVRGYREAVRNLQVALSEDLKELAQATGQDLVRRLIARKDPHLEPFYEHAKCCRLLPEPARGLALELLGIVLRATLRGDSIVFYLEHRGADCRRALSRLREDVGRVKEQIQQASSLLKPESRGSETMLATGSTTSLTLLHFLRYSRRINESSSALKDFMDRWSHPSRILVASGHDIAEVEAILGQRLDQWKRRYEGLRSTLSKWLRAWQDWADFLKTLSDHVLKPCNAALGKPWLWFFSRKKVHLELQAEHWHKLDRGVLAKAVEQIRAVVAEVDQLQDRRMGNYQRMTDTWKREFPQLQAWVPELIMQTKRQWEEVKKKHGAWRQESTNCVETLEAYLSVLDEILFSQVSAQRKNGQPAPLLLQRDQLAKLDKKAAAKALKQMSKIKLGPGYLAEVDHALQFFEELRQEIG